MKRIIALLISLALVLSVMTAGAAEGKKIRIVATIFPIYDWVREIVGPDSDRAEITLLLDSGVDLHSYQPTVQDMVKVTTSDVFIYVGGESDEWVDGALKEAVNADLKAISLVEAMGTDIRTEEIVEGMEHDHDHDHDDHDHDEDHDDDDHDHDEDHDDDDHDHDEDHDDGDHDHDEDHDHDNHDHDDHDHEDEVDEHVWLSLRHAGKLVKTIADTLCEADPEGAAQYRANAEAYMEKLAALDARYTEAAAAAKYSTVLFGDRFPFRYLTDDYGLSYYAAFSGCSAESEASFATIVFLAQKMDELGLPAVLTIENPRSRLAETIIANTAAGGQKVLTMNSMQGMTAADIQAGATYLGVMESNLAVLTEALN